MTQLPKHRAPRRAGRRRRPLRRGRRLPAADDVPRQDVRDPRGPRRASAARGTCSATRASAPTPTCTRSATRSARGPARSPSPTAPSICSTSRHRGRVRHRPEDPLRAPGRRRRRGRADDARWTVDADRRRRRRAGPATRAASCTCAPATTATPAATSPSSPASTHFAGPGRPPAAVARRTSTTPASAVVIIGSGATAVTLVPAMAETAGARHHAAALAHLHHVAAGARPARRQRSAGVLPARPPTGSSAGRTSLLAPGLLPVLPAPPEGRPAGPRRLAAKAARRRTTSTRTSTPRYDPWDQRLCVVPDGDLFPRSGPAGPTSSPTRSSASRHRHRAALGPPPRGRHHRDGHRAQPRGLRRHAAHGGRRAGRSRRDATPTRASCSATCPTSPCASGYTNASWTLRADISSQEVCNVLNHLDDHGYRYAAPTVARGHRAPADPRPVLGLRAAEPRPDAPAGDQGARGWSARTTCSTCCRRSWAR